MSEWNSTEWGTFEVQFLRVNKAPLTQTIFGMEMTFNCPGLYRIEKIGSNTRTERIGDLGQSAVLAVDEAKHLPPVEKILTKDTMAFRGHLTGCHAWRWENYSRCSCNVGFQVGNIKMFSEQENQIPPLFIDRIGDYDL